MATFLSVVSIDFLLPYSLPPAIPAIHTHSQPLGLMRSTDPTNNTPETINTKISSEWYMGKQDT
jgi:hypothetical protein